MPTPHLAHPQPENRHATFNVDVKVFSEPLHLFTLMHEVISAQPNWETDLAPRILLGLWHPRFIPQAKAILPYCRRSYIGISTNVARTYFWDACDAFSINFATLASWEGQRCVCLRAGARRGRGAVLTRRPSGLLRSASGRGRRSWSGR